MQASCRECCTQHWCTQAVHHQVHRNGNAGGNVRQFCSPPINRSQFLAFLSFADFEPWTVWFSTARVLSSRPMATSTGLKRKLKSRLTSSRKKPKTKHLTSDELPWKTVATPKEAGIASDLDGILGLEEVDDVEVVYEETEGGKVIRFKVNTLSDVEYLDC